MTLREEIRTKDMWRLMAKLTPVAVIAMSINSINTFVDALFIGQYLGEDALAAVSLAFPLSFITNGFAAMLGVGGSSVLSIAIGAKDKEKLRRVFGTVTVLAIIVALLLTALGWILAPDVIGAIGGKGEILDLGTLYYRILILGSIVQIFAVAANFLIRAEGKIKEAMTISIVSVAANMILNPLFIGYLDLGIAGAAYASIISMVIMTILDLWYFGTGRASYKVDLSYFKVKKDIAKPILFVGVSAMMLQMMFVLQQMVVYKMIDIYGSDWDIAFMGACYRILILILVPGFGFSSAMQPVAGINFGARDYERVKHAFWVFTAGGTILTTVLLLLAEIFPAVILGWMLPDATFTEKDIFNFRIMMSPGFMFSFFFMGIILYQSIGNAKVSGIVLVLREVVFFVPLVIVLPMFWGMTGIYAAPVIQNTLVFILGAFLVSQTFRKWSDEARTSDVV